jgi:AraC-like DNA-binding protein
MAEMIFYSTHPVMKSDAMRDEFRDLLTSLPEPKDYFAGRDGWFVEPPRNILVFSRRTPEEAMDGGVHVHQRFVFFWAVQGAGSIMVDGALLSLDAGQGLLLFPFQQHHFSTFGCKELLWFFVSFEVAEAPFLEPLRMRPVTISDEATGFLKRVIRAFHAGGKEAGDITAWLMLLLSRLVQAAGMRPATTGIHDSLIRNVVKLVYTCLDRPLSITEVADAVHVSASHLRREFSARMGISLGRFMLKARLNHALALLQTTDLPVGRIAEACGFGSVYAFSRAFRKEKGAAPSSCRVPGIRGGAT